MHFFDDAQIFIHKLAHGMQHATPTVLNIEYHPCMQCCSAYH